jgi:hypothetical protein
VRSVPAAAAFVAGASAAGGIHGGLLPSLPVFSLRSAGAPDKRDRNRGPVQARL